MPPADEARQRHLSAGVRVLVTGGRGFLGSRVVRRAVDLGCTVTSIDIAEPAPVAGASDLTAPRAVVADLRDRDAIRRAVATAEPEVVFHLAAMHFIPACVADPASTLGINVVGTQHLLDACAGLDESPVFVFASTADVYEPAPGLLSESATIGPDNVYGLSKLTGEGLVRIAGAQGHCEPVICRLFNLYGARETNPHVIPAIVDQLRRTDEVLLGNTTPKRDFVYVDDAADALVALSQHAPAGTTVNVGTGRSYSVDDVLDVISTLTGRAVHVTTDPSRWRPSDRANLQCDNTLLRSLVPSSVPTMLTDGLRTLLKDEGLLP